MQNFFIEKRDPKGLYKNKNTKMIGVNSDIKYEKSSYKKIILDTDKKTKKELIKKILRVLFKFFCIIFFKLSSHALFKKATHFSGKFPTAVSAARTRPGTHFY